MRLVFRPSRLLAALLVGAHALAASALLGCAIPAWSKAIGVAALAANCFFHLRRDAWLAAPRSIVAVAIGDDNAIEVTRRNGKVETGRLAAGSHVHPWFSSIAWRPQGARFTRYIAVYRDRLDGEEYRALRVWLNWRSPVG